MWNYTKIIKLNHINTIQDKIMSLQNHLIGGFWYDEIQRTYETDYQNIAFELKELHTLIGEVKFITEQLASLQIDEHIEEAPQLESTIDELNTLSNTLLYECVPKEL